MGPQALMIGLCLSCTLSRLLRPPDAGFCFNDGVLGLPEAHRRGVIGNQTWHTDDIILRVVNVIWLEIVCVCVCV